MITEPIGFPHRSKQSTLCFPREIFHRGAPVIKAVVRQKTNLCEIAASILVVVEYPAGGFAFLPFSERVSVILMDQRIGQLVVGAVCIGINPVIAVLRASAHRLQHVAQNEALFPVKERPAVDQRRTILLIITGARCLRAEPNIVTASLGNQAGGIGADRRRGAGYAPNPHFVKVEMIHKGSIAADSQRKRIGRRIHQRRGAVIHHGHLLSHHPADVQRERIVVGIPHAGQMNPAVRG